MAKPQKSDKTKNTSPEWKNLVENIHYKEIENYYSTDSIWEITKIAQKENRHTEFLRWFFDPENTQSNKAKRKLDTLHHTYDYEQVILFLKSLLWTMNTDYKVTEDINDGAEDKNIKPIFAANNKKELNYVIEQLKRVCHINNIITNVKVYSQVSEEINVSKEFEKIIKEKDPSYEKPENSNKNSDYARPDLVIQITYKFKNGDVYEKHVLPIVIENKIEADETKHSFRNAKIGQTVYYEYTFTKNWFKPAENIDEPIYIFWNANSDVDLKTAEREKLCESDKFIIYNYQTFAAKVLENLSTTDMNSAYKIIDYIRCLAYSNQRSKYPILANPKSMIYHSWELFKDENIRNSILNIAKDEDEKDDATNIHLIISNWIMSYRIIENYEKEYEDINNAYNVSKGKQNKELIISLLQSEFPEKLSKLNSENSSIANFNNDVYWLTPAIEKFEKDFYLLLVKDNVVNVFRIPSGMKLDDYIIRIKDKSKYEFKIQENFTSKKNNKSNLESELDELYKDTHWTYNLEEENTSQVATTADSNSTDTSSTTEHTNT